MCPVEHDPYQQVRPLDPVTLDPIVEPKRDTGPNYWDSDPDRGISQADIQTLVADVERYNKHLPPDQLAAKVAAVKAEAAHAGVTIKEPLDPHLVETYRAAGMRLEPQSSDYHVDLSNIASDLKPDQLANVQAVSTKWAAALGLSPDMGRALIEQIASDGKMLRSMSADEQNRWHSNMETQAIKTFGSKAAFDALKAKAVAVLALAKPFQGPNGVEDFSGAVRNSDAFHDPQILSLLATHHDMVEELRKAGKK